MENPRHKIVAIERGLGHHKYLTLENGERRWCDHTSYPALKVGDAWPPMGAYEGEQADAEAQGGNA